MQLAEAVAVRRAAPGEADGDRDAEHREQHERSDRTVEGGGRREQQSRDRELGERQEDRERRGKSFGCAERDDGLPRPLPVCELGGRRDRKDRGERQSRDESDNGHRLGIRRHAPSRQ